MASAATMDGEVLTFAAARDHLRVGAGTTDAMLSPLIAAAEGRIAGFLGRDLVDGTGWPTSDDVPAIVEHAIKLALSDFYVNREAPELTDVQLRPMIGRYQRLSIG